MTDTPLPPTARASDARALLQEARLQLEYMDDRSPTGTTPAVIARIDSFLARDASTDADHIAGDGKMIAIPSGMVEWPGGKYAPADFAPGKVMCRDGSLFHVNAPSDAMWDHLCGEADIVAYTPTPRPADQPERERIAQWIDQAISRAGNHGDTEGIWLHASQWQLVRDAILAQPGAGGEVGS